MPSASNRTVPPIRRSGTPGSSSRHKCDDDVGGMAVEVGPPPVVDGCRSGVLVARSDLDIPKRDASVECRHDEGRTEHVGVNDPEAGPLADGAHPSVRGPSIESAPIQTTQDRSFAALSDGQVDRPGCSGHERDHGWLMSLAHDPENPVPPLHPEVLDVGRTGLTHPEPIESQKHGERSVGPVEALSREEEGAELPAIHAPDLVGEDPWRRTNWAGWH